MRKILGLALASTLLTTACGPSGTLTDEPGDPPFPVDPNRKYITTDNALEDHFIVVMADDLVGTESVANAMATLQNAYPGDVSMTYHTALRGYAVNMAKEDAVKLAADPAVKYVVEDGIVTLDVDQTGATWGLDRVDQRDLPLDSIYSYNANGAGVSVYIIDTGINLTHEDFGGRAQLGTDTIGDGQNGNDCNGHGTHVAGTVGGVTWGVAKNVDLYAVRVLSCSGSGTWAQVIGGVDWVTANAQLPAVANMSLGGGVNQALNDAVANSVAAGVVYAVAAGNESTDACTRSPASTPEAITVGSTTSSDARSSFSNYGTCVDLFAPGSSITSAWIGSNTATNTISGTSMATPHVAGGIALYLGQNPAATPTEVEAAIEGQASVDKVSNPGNGSPNLLLYTAFIGGGGDIVPPSVGITDPADGATVSDVITIAADASDDTGVTSVEFFVDGNSIGSDASAPYSIDWDTATAGNGSHSVAARAYDAAGNSGNDSISVTVSNGGGGGNDAVYDPALGTAVCATPGNSCDSVDLFVGRGTLSGGAEPNQPNTLDGCADGNAGTFHYDESNDAVRVYTLSGNNFAEGETVRVEADVWAWSTGSSDKLDVFHAADAANPTWTLIATLSASGGGAQTLSTTFDLPAGELQAVRAQWRYVGSAVPCSTGSYNDRDDLVFATGGGTGEASYDPTMQIPVCTGAAASCTSLDLLDGRGAMSGGAEQNAPNTVYGSCADGSSGSYHADESVDQIVVTSASGNLSAGTALDIAVTAYFWSGATDHLDIYYSENPTAPAPGWTLIGTFESGSSGLHTITASHTPSSSGVHAVRAQIRWNGSASECTSGSYNDRDDLGFDVQ